jgi:hypothetical protein
MERSFSVEAKSFRFSAKVGCPNLRLEERRKGFVGYIFASTQCSEWLVETVESAVLAQEKEEIAKTFREGEKAMMVHGGANKSGRFLEVSFLAVGGRKGVIWLPEGRFGRGWRRFAGELRRLLEAQKLSVGSEEAGDSTAKAVRGSSSPDIDPKRSYAQALCASLVAVKRADPVRLLDTFPVSKCFESRNDGEGLRVAVDCAAFEAAWPETREAAGCVRVPSSGEEDGLKKLLRLLHLKLDRVLVGLSLRPNRWPDLDVGLDVVVEKEPGPELGLDPCMGQIVVPGSDPDLGSDLGQDSYMALDSGVVSVLKQASKELGAATGSPKIQRESSPGSLVRSSEFSRTLGSGAEAGTVEDVFGVVGDLSAQGEGPIGKLQVHSSRSPELLTEKSPISPECSPELSLIRGLDVDDGNVVEDLIGVVGDSSAQGDAKGEIPVRYPDFPLPWEYDGESDEESDSGDMNVGECDSVTVDPPVEQDPGMADGHPLPAEESDLALTVVSPPDAGDGSSAEEFLEFLPAGSMSKDWQDFFSSSHTDRRGLSDSELIKEAFAPPWEVDELASPSCRDKEDSSSGHPFPVKGMLRRGFLGSKIASSPALSPALASSSTSEVIAAPAMVSVGSKESEDGHVDLDPDPDPVKCAVGLSPLDFCTFDTAIDTTSVELTDTQRGLIERMRKELKVNDTTKVVLKHIEEIFLRVNKGVRDGVLPAEEGESLLAFHFEQIEKFLSGILDEQPRIKGKRERRNLESSINYGIAPGPSRTRKGKVTVM